MSDNLSGDGGAVEVLDDVAASVGLIRRGVDQLLADPLSRLSAADLVAAMTALEVQRRRLAAVDQVFIAELELRGVSGEYGFASARDFLASLLRVAPGEASARVRAAADLGPRRATTGEQLAAVFPVIASGQRAGVVSAAQAKVITGCITAMRQDLREEHWDTVEADLTGFAATLGPRELGIVGRRLVELLDPDGPATSDAEHERRRNLTLNTNSDGSGEIRGHLTPACLAILRAALDPLAAPAPAEDGAADCRTSGQRLHDALQDAAHRLLAAGDLPGTGGIPATLIISMTDQEFATRRGTATTAHGDPISVSEALRLGDQADVITAVLTADGGIHSYGRDRRIASPSQRLALMARDKGCSFPSCTKPMTWTEAHHVRAWVDGGETSVENMTLVCGFHHRNFERLGWTVSMQDGVPQWTAPAWLDPGQTALRNRIPQPRWQ